MTNVNENNLMVNGETGEILPSAELVQSRNNIHFENDEYIIIKGNDGKFVRKAKFQEYSSFKTESRQDKLWLLNLLDGGEDTGQGMKDNVGAEIEVEHIIFNPYDKIDENTGDTEYGVLTYLITPDKEAYVTSSKSVYFSIKKIMELFGKPSDAEWENIKIKIGKQKMQNGDAITVKMVG